MTLATQHIRSKEDWIKVADYIDDKYGTKFERIYGGVKMKYSIKYITYGNSDFQKQVFCDSYNEAVNIAKKLSTLVNVSGVHVLCETHKNIKELK